MERKKYPLWVWGLVLIVVGTVALFVLVNLYMSYAAAGH